MKISRLDKINKIRRRITLFLICASMVMLCNIISVAGKNTVKYYGDKNFVKAIKAEKSNPGKGLAKGGKKYYIATDGNDANSGTKDAPFATFEHAISKLKKGDTLYVRGGEYSESVVFPSTIKGEYGKYITVRPYSTEEVSIKGTSKPKQQNPIISIEGAAYLRIFGLKICDATGEDACGIYVAPGTNHLIISNNTVCNISKGEATGEACANGILLFGESAKKTISNVFIYKNKITDCTTGWAEACSVTANCKYINIVSNTVKNITNIGIDLSGNYKYCKTPSKDFPRKCLVYKNKVSNCVSPYATSYGLYVDGGQNIDVISNTVSKCSGGIEIGAEQKPSDTKYSTRNITVKNNTVKDNIENGISVGGYKKSLGWVMKVKVAGNKCTNNGKDNAILTLAKCKDISISKNTFVNEKGDSAIVYSEFSKKYTKGITFKNNKFYNGHSSKDTYFYYLGKKYTSFNAWTKVVGKDCGKYTKK